MLNHTKLLLRLFVLLFLTSCFKSTMDYNLDQPTSTVKLPKVLTEISGLEYVSKNTLACVQDETAIIYFIDIQSGKIKDQIVFGKKGDYEGIAFFNKKAFVLRSDGRISRISNKGVVKNFDFEKKGGFDFEGLCLDKENHRLLIACKEHSKQKKNEDFIFIYGFSLIKKRYLTKPVYKISKKKLGKKFQPSGIAIDHEGMIYIPSAYSKKLLVLSPEGEVYDLLKLTNKKFVQAEGICFGEKNELYISNEGASGRSNLLTFSHR